MKRRTAALLLAAALTLTLCGTAVLAAEDKDAVPGEPGTGTVAPDPAGSLTFANLDRRLRENNFNLLALEENIAAIQSINYEALQDSLRDGLNSIAEAQWGLISMGSMLPPEMGALGSLATSSSMQSLQQAYDGLRDTFDDLKEGKLQADNADLVRQLRSAQDQIVMASEAMYIALVGMEQTLTTLDRGLETLDRTIREMELRHKLGQISALTLQDVKANRTALESSRQTLVTNIRTYKMQLELMIGAELTGGIALGALPEVTAGQLGAMDLEADLEAYLTASYDLYAAGKTLDDAEEDFKDAQKKHGYNTAWHEYQTAEHQVQAARYVYASTTQGAEMRFRTLYDQVKDNAQILEAARAALKTKEADYAAMELKYRQGTISQNQLLSARDEVEAAGDEVRSAGLNLFTNYNNYRWAVDHGILNG